MLTKFLNFVLKRKIKGNVNANKDMIFYNPEHRLYEFVDAERWFSTEEKALKAGFRKPIK
jgi:hypothetical protein